MKFAVALAHLGYVSASTLEIGDSTITYDGTSIDIDKPVKMKHLSISTDGGEQSLELKSTGNLGLYMDSGVHSFTRHHKDGVPKFEHGLNPDGIYYMNQNPSSGDGGAAIKIMPDSDVQIPQLDIVGGRGSAGIKFRNDDALARVAAVGICAGQISRGCGYGSMKVVRSNGVSCNSACDANDGSDRSAPYQDYYCYGSANLDYLNDGDINAGSSLVASGWFGVNYCGGTNGMSTYCCCKSQYPSNKGC